MSNLHAFARRLAESVAAHDPAGLRSPLPVGEIMQRMMPYRSCRSALGLDTAEEYELLLLRLVAEQAGLAQTFPPESAERCRVEVAAVLPDLAFLKQLQEVTVLLNLTAIAEVPADQAEVPEEPEFMAGQEETGPEPEATAMEGEEPTVSVGEVDDSDLAADTDDPAEAEPVSTAAEAAPDPVDQLLDPLDFDPEAEGLESEAPEAPPASAPAEELLGHDFDSSEFAIPPAAPVAGGAGVPPPLPVMRWETPVPPAGPGEPPLECPHCDRTLPRGRAVRFCPACGQNVLVRLCRSCRAEMEPDWRHCVMCGHEAGGASRFA